MEWTNIAAVEKMKVQAARVPWYKREHFAELLELFADSGKLHDNYEDWLRAAERVVANIEAQGVKVIRAEIEPAPFRSWRQSEGLQPDVAGRPSMRISPLIEKL